VRDRIAFAAAHCAIAVDALRAASPGIGLVAVGGLAFQALWGAIWVVAALGIERAISRGGSATDDSNTGAGSGGAASGGAGAAAAPTKAGGAGGIVVFLLLVSYYWTAMTIKNVVAFCASSVVGSWWFHGASDKAPVSGAVKRALTTSLGTLSLGALLVAVVKALRAMARAAERNARENNNGAAFVAACIANCLLSIVEMIAEWANMWATVYASLTGLDFAGSGRAAIELFKSRGWTALINDDLVGNALALGAIASAFLAAVAGGGIAWATLGAAAVSRGTTTGIAAGLSFAVALGMASIVVSLVSTSVRAVFVCFSINPVALAATHPDALANLAAAWRQFHPEEWSACG
jgi:hypothetical protein